MQVDGGDRMTRELIAARCLLQAAGLTVRADTDSSLWIASEFTTFEDGLRLASDACAIQRRNGVFVAVLPSLGHQTIEVPGPISHLSALVLAAYLRHRRQGGAFRDAVQAMLEKNRQLLSEVA
jgi:hypothetical protein